MKLEYYVNIDSAYPPKIHTSTCRHAQERPEKTQNGGWSQPYHSYQAAWDYAMTRVRTRRPQNCTVCKPHLHYYVNIDSAHPPKIHASTCMYSQIRSQKTAGGWNGPHKSYQAAWDYAMTRVRTSRPQNCTVCKPHL